MAVLAKGLKVPFMVEGEHAKKVLEQKPTTDEIKCSRKTAAKFERGFVEKKK